MLPEWWVSPGGQTSSLCYFWPLDIQILGAELVVTAGAVAGENIAGLGAPAALAAFDIADRELSGAALGAEFAGVFRAAETLPAGLELRLGLGRTAAFAELAGVLGTAAFADPADGGCRRSGCHGGGCRRGSDL